MEQASAEETVAPDQSWDSTALAMEPCPAKVEAQVSETEVCWAAEVEQAR